MTLAGVSSGRDGRTTVKNVIEVFRLIDLTAPPFVGRRRAIWRTTVRTDGLVPAARSAVPAKTAR